VGSVVVAVACSAQHALDNPSDRDGGVLDALLDSISSETRDALAAEKPTIDTGPCDKTVLVGTTPFPAAQRSYPGRSKEDLARASVLVCTSKGDYPCYQAPASVKDGGLQVTCGAPSDTATFVVPSAL